MGFLDVGCVCGHVIDEHEGQFFKSCTIPGCGCEDFEGDGESDPDEDDEG
jgi:hypothetical protein